MTKGENYLTVLSLQVLVLWKCDDIFFWKMFYLWTERTTTLISRDFNITKKNTIKSTSELWKDPFQNLYKSVNISSYWACIFHFELRVNNCGVQVKSSLPPVIVNKVPLEHSYNYYLLCIISGYFHAITTDLSNCDRDHMALKV